MIYLAIFALQVVAILATNWASRERLYLYYPLLLFLFLFAAFRFEVGCDWSGYYNQWMVAGAIESDDALFGREPLWWGFLALAQWAGADYMLANVVTSLAFFVGVHHLAKRQADPFLFVVLLFPVLIINMPMSAIRQALAIGLMCFAYSAFIDMRLRRFLVIVAIATGFHSSAAVFFALAPFVTHQLTRDRLIVAGILALPMVVLMLVSSQADLAYSRYVESDAEAFGALFRVLLLLSTSVVFLTLMRKAWRERFPADYNLVLLMGWASVGLLLLLPISSVVADRLAYYLIPIQAMIVVRTRLILTRWQGQALVAGFLLGLTAFLGIWTALSSHFEQCYLPYQNELLGTPVSTKAY